MRVLISGGGTGGHIYPALAVATQLQNTHHADILYLGSDDGLETEIIPAAGLRLAVIKAGKLRRYLCWQAITGVARIPVGMAQALTIVHRFRPDVAFTSGGYVAVPAGLAARINSVPLLMHQQDVPPNLSNKLLAPLATRISLSFRDSVQHFPAGKTLLLGNPVRQAILDIRQTAPQQSRSELGFMPDVPLVLVTGGSQGARHLNRVVCHALPELLKTCQILHISGQKLLQETRELSKQTLAHLDAETQQRYQLVPYMSEQMPLALQAADLVICRAGAATLSELAVLGKPSILVPLPPTIGSSPQETNAATFARAQAAEVIRNDDLKPDMLLARVNSILTQPACLQSMVDALKAFAKPDATQAIVATILTMVKMTRANTSEQEVSSI